MDYYKTPTATKCRNYKMTFCNFDKKKLNYVGLVQVKTISGPSAAARMDEGDERCSLFNFE